MADTMQFDLVSPERSLASLAATAVKIPGTEGDLTAMPGHAAVLTSLRPGIVRVQSSDGEKTFVVTRGFAEISAPSISIIAEAAHPGETCTEADLVDIMAEARKTAAEATGEIKDNAEMLIADLVQLMADMS